jgi:hypothetical protein
MIPPGSRYQDAEKHFAPAHLYNEWGYPLVESDDQNGAVYVRVATRHTTYLMTTAPDPVPPPLEYYAKETENLQFLAYKLLDDPKRWNEIADANPRIWYPLDLQAGDYLRIPS